MELPSKKSEQIAINTRPKVEEHMLIIMNQSTHEEHLLQSLQTNNKQPKLAVTFLTGYSGIFNVINKNNKFYFTVSINNDEFIVFFYFTWYIWTRELKRWNWLKYYQRRAFYRRKISICKLTNFFHFMEIIQKLNQTSLVLKLVSFMIIVSEIYDIVSIDNIF